MQIDLCLIKNNQCKYIAVREGGRLLMAATYDGDGDRVSSASLFCESEEQEANNSEQGLVRRRGVPKQSFCSF